MTIQAELDPLERALELDPLREIVDMYLSASLRGYATLSCGHKRPMTQADYGKRQMGCRSCGNQARSGQR